MRGRFWFAWPVALGNGVFRIYVFCVGVHFYFFRFMICMHPGAVLAFMVSAF